MKSEGFLKIPGCSDPQSVEQSIAELEPWLRRVIRLRLNGGRLRRLADTGDVFQSLMRDFVSRKAAVRPPTVYGPSLKRYLVGAVRNKIRARLRKERRNLGSLGEYPEPLSREVDPPQNVAERDFVEAIHSRLNGEDRQLFELRREGFTWPQVAMMIGGRSDALRMRLRRSVAAVIVELNR